jgi:TolB protein
MITPRRRVTILAVTLTVALAAGSARAVVTGQIFGPGSQSFPIAVAPLKNLGGDNDGALGKQFARVLSRDLELSGYFKLVDPRTFIEDQSSGINADEIDFVGWASIGAQELVKGGVTVDGDKVTVEARLFDVPARRDIPEVGRRVSGSRADVPRMAHRFADQLLEVLTGERGPFDTQIVFTSTRGGRGLLKELYLWTFDRDDPVRLTSEQTLMAGPHWRADNHAVLFTSWKEHQPRLFQLELPSKRVSRLFPGSKSVMQGGAWSPDGSRVAATVEQGGNTDIVLLDRSGAVIRQLTDHWAADVSPTWSPDGQRIAFNSDRSGAPQIYVMNVDGSGVRRVSTIGNYNTAPSWSPKGDKIAYATRAGGGFQIVVIGADGSGGKTVTSQGSNEDPSWAPDGRYIIFSTSRGGARHLALTDRDGRVQRELTRGTADDTSPAWSARLEW